MQQQQQQQQRAAPRDDYELKVKLLMIGDSGVGKTSMLLRYTNDSFHPTFITTIGIDFKIKAVRVEGGKRVKLQIWDTAGQERFRTITTSYFRGAHGILMVYDVTDRTSFLSIRNWVAQTQMHADVSADYALVGNKCDCDEAQRAVAYEEGAALAREFGIRHFYEASAKQDHHVEACFAAVTADAARRLLAATAASSDGAAVLLPPIARYRLRRPCC